MGVVNSKVQGSLWVRFLLSVTFIVTVHILCQSAEASGYDIRVDSGRLSVTADAAQFGSLIDEIARDAGFEVTVSPEVASKTLSTEFSDLDLERGIQRLMGLIRHRNFFMLYAHDGSIKKIEIYGKSGNSSQPASRPTPRKRTPGRRTVPSAMVQPPGPVTEMAPLDGSRMPYIPPAAMPKYIPPRR